MTMGNGMRSTPEATPPPGWITLHEAARESGHRVEELLYMVASGEIEARVSRLALPPPPPRRQEPAAPPTSADPSPRAWLTINEAAHFMNISRSTVYRLIEERRLQSRILGARTRRISGASIERYLDDAEP